MGVTMVAVAVAVAETWAEAVDAVPKTAATMAERIMDFFIFCFLIVLDLKENLKTFDVELSLFYFFRHNWDFGYVDFWFGGVKLIECPNFQNVLVTTADVGGLLFKNLLKQHQN